MMKLTDDCQRVRPSDPAQTQLESIRFRSANLPKIARVPAKRKRHASNDHAYRCTSEKKRSVLLPLGQCNAMPLQINGEEEESECNELIRFTLGLIKAERPVPLLYHWLPVAEHLIYDVLTTILFKFYFIFYRPTNQFHANIFSNKLNIRHN